MSDPTQAHLWRLTISQPGNVTLVMTNAAADLRIYVYAPNGELAGLVNDVLKTPQWLELKLDQIFCLSRHAQLDGKLAGAARRELSILEAEYGGAEFPGLGDATLRARARWLGAQIP